MTVRPRFAMLLVPLVATLSTVAGPAALADEDQGRASRGTLRPAAAPCLPIPVPGLSGACTHGPDDRAALGLPSADAGDTAASRRGHVSRRSDEVPLRCSSGAGNRVQVLYAHAPRRGRMSRVLPQIEQAVREANGIFVRSAQQTRGSRQLAVVTRPSGKQCAPAVVDVTVSSKALNDFVALVGELRAQGFARDDRKYVVFGDGTTSVCGLGTLVLDDRATPMNGNNHGGSYALVGSGHDCWKGVVVAHELLHAFGGLQPSAPHATGGYHCNDGHDVMCYDDGSSRSRQRSACGSAMERRLDCNHDDYFSTAPRPGSYLAEHWNVASSSFLHGGGPPAPRPPGSPGGLTARPFEDREPGQGHPDEVELSWSAAAGRVTAYRVSLPGGAVVTLPPTSRAYTHQQAPRHQDCSYVVTAVNEAGAGPGASVTVPARRPTALVPAVWPPPAT